MTLRAWIITMRGRIREALCPELQVLREENRDLRARRPLTDEEIDKMWRKFASEEGFTTAQFVRNFARAIERKITGGNE
jgi:malate synthase